jgi:hypothetical protein
LSSNPVDKDTLMMGTVKLRNCGASFKVLRGFPTGEARDLGRAAKGLPRVRCRPPPAARLSPRHRGCPPGL